MDRSNGTINTIMLWTYTFSMSVLTAIAEYAGSIEPDRLVWMLGFAGAFFGAAMFPSTAVWKTLVKLMFGWIISGVLSTPVASSHYAPEFVNVHVAALWLGFAGPALFMATYETNILARFKKAAQ